MKRTAESQLTKDAREDEDESQEVGTGFQKADTSALSERKIRGLPKRSVAASPTAVPSPMDGVNGSAPELPRFTAFSGFGAPGAASTFTFTSPTPQPPSTPPALPLAPASKGLSSFTSQPNPTPPSTPPLTSSAQGKQDAALKYYMSLRGINSSFLDTAKKALQADPFLDITEMLESYKSVRLSTQNEFDRSLDSSTSRQDAKPMASSSTPHSSTAKPPAMPMPPKSFFGFGANTGSTGSSASSGGGFTPKEVSSSSAGVSSSPFSFAKSATSASGASTKPFSALASVTPSDKASIGGFAFSFTKPNPTPSTTPFGTPSSAFGAAKTGTTTAESKPNVTSDPMSEKNESPPEKATIPSFSFKPSTPAAPLTPGFSSFMNPSKVTELAGDTSTPPSNKSGLPGTSPPSQSAFGFGAGKSFGGSSAFGSFGKGSIGNPVGFAFGSPPATPGTAQPSEAAATIGDSNAAADSGTNDGSLSVPADTTHDPSPVPSQGSAYDVDGPGEEDETTLHESKARAYKVAPTGEKKGWVSVGSGQLKLKAHVDLPKRRILMRNSSTGQVILNFNLYPGFNVTTDKKTISFCVPGEDEAAVVYQLRTPNETEAQNWQETIHKEVDKLVPSDDT